ncbi:MAG: tRNA1(Val) (adenine(37)-N6)-methyltransferase, partial [Methylosarcina sp.]
FFERHLQSRNALRRTARHTEHLPFAELIGIIGKLLKPQGYFYLLLPVHAIANFSELALEVGLYAIKETLIRGFAHGEARVGALTFSRSRSECVKERVTVYESVGVYTEESERYLSAFLLRFADSRGKALK